MQILSRVREPVERITLPFRGLLGGLAAAAYPVLRSALPGAAEPPHPMRITGR